MFGLDEASEMMEVDRIGRVNGSIDNAIWSVSVRAQLGHEV